MFPERKEGIKRGLARSAVVGCVLEEPGVGALAAHPRLRGSVPQRSTEVNKVLRSERAAVFTKITPHS